MVLAMVLLLGLFTLVNYALDPVRLSHDFGLFADLSRNFLPTLTVWFLMMASSYIAFHFTQTYNRDEKAALENVAWKYLMYQAAVLLLPMPYLLYADISITLRLAFAMEQVRFIMKMHAFVAEVTWMTTKEKVRDVTFSHLLYFLFAPTLVFRVQYPRTEKIVWSRAIALASQFLLVLFVAFITIPSYLQQLFSAYGTSAFTPASYVKAWLHSSLLAVEIIFVVWFGILHVWQNLFAELLTFADRKFYDRWWLLGQFSRYYREWNIVVHDWLHTYVYRELLSGKTKGNRASAAIAVFLLSAVFHEYIITIAFHFYYPVMFVLFVSTGLIVYFTSLYFRNWYVKYGNVFLFFSLFFGWTVQIVLYTSEYYARTNCPQAGNFLYDKLFPRSWSCF